jgi:alanine dehydrogenase
VGRRVKYHVHLFRESTGDALGIVDGRRITSLRTSATAAAAVRHWAGDRRVRIGLIGSGEEAREGLRAIHGAVAVEKAMVFSPTPANRAAFADSMGAELDLSVTAADSQADVLGGCDVLYVATSSHHTAFLSAEDVAGIGLVSAIGSTAPVHRELFGDVFTGADAVVVDTPDATHESGDCIEAVAQGWDASSVQLLGDYLGTTPGATAGRTVFKSIGSVEQDLVLAHHLLEAAAEQDRGTLVDPVGSLRLMR